MTADAAVILLRMELDHLLPLPLPSGFVLEPFADSAAAEVEALLIAARADGLAGPAVRQVGWFDNVRRNPDWNPSLVLLVRRSSDGILAAVAHSWRSGFLKDLAVDERFRRLGLAGALICETAKRFRDRGHRSLDLKVLSANAPARKLYETMGFREPAV